MKRLVGTGLLLLAGGTVLAVLGYNVWSYCCGHCTAQTFLSPGPFGFGLLLLIFFATAFLAWLRRRGRRSDRSHYCRCGQPLADDWRFCADCGQPVTS